MELQSNSITEITKAMVKAQFAMEPAKKTQANPFFKSKYAGLEDVIKAVKQPLFDNDLCFIQSELPGENGAIVIVTTLAHISGEWFRSYLPIKPVKNDPQSMGSAITYGKRYGLQSLVGQPSEDDDGNNATQKPKVDNQERQKLAYELDLLLSEEGKEMTDNEKKQIARFFCNTIKAPVLTIEQMPVDMLTRFTAKVDDVFKAFLDSLKQ